MKKSIALISAAILYYFCIACNFQSDNKIKSNPSSENASVSDITSIYEWEEVSGGIKLTKYLDDEKKIVVPASIGNKAVISVGVAFSGNIVVEDIELPDSVKYGDFTGCKALKRMVAPGISSPHNLNMNGCDSLEYLDLSGIEELNETAFSYSLPVQELKLPKLKNFSLYQFSYMPELRKLDISSATSISVGYYKWSSSLEEVKINENFDKYRISSDTGKVGMIYIDKYNPYDESDEDITQSNISEVYCELFQHEKIVINGMEYKK